MVPQLKSHTKRVTQNSIFRDRIQEVLRLDQRVGLLDTMTEVMRHSKVKSKNWKSQWSHQENSDAQHH